MIEKLIDRQLAVQKAKALGLERQPEVMIRLEEARRDVLAAAYAYTVSSAQTAPSEEEVSSYYAQNPALFEARKLYLVREVVVPHGNPGLAAMQQRLDRKEGLGDALTVLRMQGGSFSDQVVHRAAEQLPLNVLEQLSRLKLGDTIAFSFPRGLVAYQLQQVHAAPKSLKTTRPEILEHLKRARDDQAVRQAVSELRQTARIERPTATP